MKAEGNKMTKSPDVHKANYIGNGRYDLQIEGKKNAGERLTLLGFFTVSTDKDNIVTIASSEIKDKDKKEIEALGIKIDGTLEVKIPRNAEIIYQNATSTPSLMGMLGGYSWKIGGIGQRPMLKFRIKH